MRGATGPVGGFEVFSRERWIDLGRAADRRPADASLVLTVAARESVDPDEIRDIYLPLARWIDRRLSARHGPPGAGSRTAGSGLPATAVIGVTGSVAAGKTTTARVLVGLLRGGEDGSSVEMLTTDGFLFPNRVLEQRGLLDRKGFPETYDHRALAAALAEVRSGRPEVAVPVYSHRSYDIVPGEVQWIRHPDLLVVEGLTVLQQAPGDGATDPLVDLAVYVDAEEEDIAHWHAERLSALRSAGDAEASDFLRWLTSLSDAELRQVAESSWSEINLVNLRDHVAPTRGRADVILEKGPDHRVRQVLLRSAAASAG